MTTKSHKFAVGQLVSTTYFGLPAIAAIIVSLRFARDKPDGYNCAIAHAKHHPMRGAGDTGWFQSESDLTDGFNTAPAKRKTLSKRATLTPSAKSIAEHLAREGNVSGVEAAAMYKTRQLPGRISELRNAGYDIASNFDVDRLGQRYVRYHLVKAPALAAA